MPAKPGSSYRRYRQAAQVLSLVIFFWLFRQTDYSGSDEIKYAVNLLFRLDPLIAMSTVVAAREWIGMLWPSFITLAATLLLGRFFCGWICPLGTLLDGFRAVSGKKSRLDRPDWTVIKYGILVFVLTCSLFGVALSGLVDPFSILVRALSVSVDPALYSAATDGSAWLYKNAPDWITRISESIYAFMKTHLLPFDRKVFSGAFFSFAILGTIFLLEFRQRRFWCRNLCPLGALLALISRFALLRGHGGNDCSSCQVCRSVCRTGAIDDQRRISPQSCIVCLDCVDRCPQAKIKFRMNPPESKYTPESMSRRAFMTVVGSGLIIPAVLKSSRILHHSEILHDTALIRPPGAAPEKEFLQLCVRCGECMKVCIGNALHPTLLESGIEGIMTPRLIARIGYCEYNCTLCGQVCPTGALRKLSQEEKHATVIGTAHIDKNRCLPFAEGTPCIVCEEHCPTPDKAIKFDEVIHRDVVSGDTRTIRQPHIVEDLCIGCGICETQCPLEGKSAILITAQRESRNPDLPVYYP